MSMLETLSTPGGKTTAQSWQEEGEAGVAAGFLRRDRALAVLPPLALAVMIASWGVDLPYFDQWELIPRFALWSEGQFPWRQIWNFHNEHRLLVPELIMLLVGKVTHWNILVELWINLLLGIGIFAVLSRQLRRSIGGGVGARRFSPALPLLSLIVFSPSQWGNWSWGWQIQIFLAMLMVAAAILLLSQKPRRPATFAGAVACALVAPFSFANGLLLFPLALPLVLADKRGRAAYGAAWLTAFAAAYYVYGIDQLKPRFHELNTGSLEQRLLAQGDYFLHYLAGPLLAHRAVVAWVAHGLVPLSLLLLGYFLWRHLFTSWRELLPWLTLAGFGLASAAMTAYGRYTFGIEQALSTRYFTIANFYWIGLLGIFVLVRQRQPAAGLPGRDRFALGVLLVCLLGNAAIGSRDFRRDSFQREWLRAQLRGEIPAAANLIELLPFPDPQAVRDRIEMMKQLEISTYRR